MRKLLIKLLLAIVILSVPIFIYASLYRPDIVGEVFRGKITSPPAIFTAMIFVVSMGGIIWKKLKLAINSKGK